MIFGKNGNSNLNVESNEIIAVDLNMFAEAHQWQTDERLINKFIAANSLQMTKDPNRVRYAVSTAGTGTDAINANSNITVNYTGRLLDGTVFDTNTAGTFVTQLKNLVKGWVLTLPGKVTKGGKIRIIMPSDLGYAGTPPGTTIPINSCLDFDIEIVDVKN
ncbi:FKBP-type peptidyl-prolyl cis-trans isomerase [Pedobacter sp. NJ-S-72]